MNKYINYHKSHYNTNINIIRKVFQSIPILRPIYDSYIINLPINATILDIGCGDGHLFRKALSYRVDLKLHGIDIVESIGLDLKDIVEFHQLDLNQENPKLPTSTYDLIISSHVLEHLQIPEKIFSIAYELLKISGFLIVETPSPRMLFIPAIFPRYFKDYPTFNFWDDPTHIRPFSRKALIRLALEYNYEIIRVKKERNILFIILFPLIIIHSIVFRNGSRLSGLVKNIFGTANIIILKKRNSN